MLKHNSGRAYDEKVSEHSRYLTPVELTTARLQLAREMVQLVLRDGDAGPPALVIRLQCLASALEGIIKHARRRG